MNVKSKFMLTLVRERTKRGLNLREAAEICKVSSATYWKWENGICTPSIENADNLLKAFGTSMMIGASDETF